MKEFCRNTLIMWFLLILPQGLGAQSEDSNKKLQNTIVQIQMEMEEYQGELQGQLSVQSEMLEQAKIRIDEVLGINEALQLKIEKLETQQQQNEETIEELKKASANVQFDELSGIISALMLEKLGVLESFEEKLISLLNEGSNLPPDQLILLLAESHKRRGAFEESLGYYALIISDHPSSNFHVRSIFEASEILGKFDQKDQQQALLESISESEEYGERVMERLNSLSN